MSEKDVPAGKADNTIRGLRTGAQAAAGFLVAIPVIDIWNNYVANHAISDPTLKFAIGVILAALVGWAQNAVEDRTKRGLLPLPVDRQAGDAVIGDGIGTATGKIVGDTDPVSITQFRKKAT